MKTIITGWLCVLAYAGLFAAESWETRWRGFYDQQTLRYWSTQTPPGIEENFREVLWKNLTEEERRRLGEVQLEFPLEDASHPMNFYSASDLRRIRMPVSAIRFFGDVTMAYSWLQVKGYSIDPVSDYLGMLKYQWPKGLAGKSHRPMEALGIPPNAREDAAVMRTFQTSFNTAMVFILGHELGHLYHQHRGYDPDKPEESRRHETQADEFALEMMRRINTAPLGAAIFFNIGAHMQSMPGDSDYEKFSAARTHPSSGQRLLAASRFIEKHLDSFSRGTRDAQGTRRLLEGVIVKLQDLATIDDTGVQHLLRQKGQTTKPEDLKPRRVGEVVSSGGKAARSGVVFDGDYEGRWLDAKGTDLPGKMHFTRTENMVKGEFRFGVGTIELNGEVEAGELIYSWRWGTDYFGKGVMRSALNGNQLTGTWGHTQKREGGGTWDLKPSAPSTAVTDAPR